MSLKLVQKRPDERLDYDINFRKEWLTENDPDIILDIVSAIEVSDGGTLALDGTDFTGDIAKVWIKDGMIGESALVVVTAITQSGRIKDFPFRVRVRETY